MINQAQDDFFNELYASTNQKVLAYIIVKCGKTEDVADIFQETYTEVVKIIQKHGISYFKQPDALVMQIAKRKIFRHYKLKEKVIEWESVFWKEEIEPNIFKALIDTTFAVYKPYFIGEPIDPDCFCIRTGYPYSVRHLPWYMNSAKPTEEELYYLGHIKTLTHWSKQNQTNTNSAKKE